MCILVVWAGRILSPFCAAEDASAIAPAPRRAIVIYGDRDNGFELATLLHKVGLSAKPVPHAALTPDWTTDANLVVVASCCPGGWQRDSVWSDTLLDRMGQARVLACGDTGASLLATKGLLIGYPYGIRGQGPVDLVFPANSANHEGFPVLNDPLAAMGKLMEKRDEIRVEAQIGQSDAAHVVIYDGGQSREGTTGIAHYHGRRHRWLICRQGNYTLWGIGTFACDLTRKSKLVFANLAWHLAHAEPAPLVFPEKAVIDAAREATLTGGARDECYHTLARTGVLTVRLSWNDNSPLTLMMHGPVVWPVEVGEFHDAEIMKLMMRGPVVQKVSGKSPLTLSFQVDDAMVGKDVEIAVDSSFLKDGEECRFELSLDWED